MTTLTPLWHQCSMQSAILCLVHLYLLTQEWHNNVLVCPQSGGQPPQGRSLYDGA